VEYREVLVMRDIQGFSYEEIRDVLRIPDGTVKSRLSRARNALKDCLIKVIGDL
jgi:RNA polymerase sigma-70 factor (ECF subfamily)